MPENYHYKDNHSSQFSFSEAIIESHNSSNSSLDNASKNKAEKIYYPVHNTNSNTISISNLPFAFLSSGIANFGDKVKKAM